MKVQVPVKAIEELAASGLTNYISPDVMIESFGHVTATTGTDLVRTQSSLLGLITTSSLDGSGIGIAVLDSGVDTGHRAFDGGRINSTKTSQLRITRTLTLMVMGLTLLHLRLE